MLTGEPLLIGEIIQGAKAMTPPPLTFGDLALVCGAFLVGGYFHGPGWLPHLECPHCCWCGGGEPFGERVERRLVALGGDR